MHARLVPARWAGIVAAVVLIILGSWAAAVPVAGELTPGDCAVTDDELALSPLEYTLIDAINTYRAALGAPALEVSPSLTRAAVWKSEARAAGAPEAHDDPFRPWDQRLADCGYDLPTAKGENLARVTGELAADEEPAVVVTAWQGSPAHDAVLRDPVYAAAGVARIQAGGTIYWTAIFGGIPDYLALHVHGIVPPWCSQVTGGHACVLD
jgi:uncharacterized protein YkwD